ncbi:hypothetical protein H4582DRAFT_1858902 [Lactarius indigo]|nr:hypothetical protein H4582DRAFT_1858902 [Lactarius indigo]
MNRPMTRTPVQVSRKKTTGWTAMMKTRSRTRWRIWLFQRSRGSLLPLRDE